MRDVRLNRIIVYILLPIACLLGSRLTALAQFNGIVPTAYYLELGTGTTAYHHSHISGMGLSRIPIHVYAEFGKISKRFAIVAGYDFNTRYKQSNYQLAPAFGFLHLKADILTSRLGRTKAELFGFAGPTYGSTRLIDEGNDTVINYELKEESEKGMGFSMGLGGQLVWNRWVLAAKMYMVRSKASYLAGGFSNQSFQTGSDRLQITLGYRINLNQYYNERSTCPTYK